MQQPKARAGDIAWRQYRLGQVLAGPHRVVVIRQHVSRRAAVAAATGTAAATATAAGTTATAAHGTRHAGRGRVSAATAGNEQRRKRGNGNQKAQQCRHQYSGRSRMHMVRRLTAPTCRLPLSEKRKLTLPPGAQNYDNLVSRRSALRRAAKQFHQVLLPGSGDHLRVVPAALGRERQQHRTPLRYAPNLALQYAQFRRVDQVVGPIDGEQWGANLPEARPGVIVE